MARVVTYEDAERVDYTESFPDGSRAFATEWKTGSGPANRLLLEQIMETALAGNAAYLGRTNPTVAQNTAQVQALTRQVSALVRTALSRLDSVSGT